MQPLAGRRVLLVEDEMIIALDMVAILESFGAEVIGPAGSVAQALTLIEETNVDCAVLDINLNGETVYPVAHVLERRGVRFVFMTGYEKIDRNFCKHPVLQKPVDFQELKQAILCTCGNPAELLGATVAA
jgi:two-component SAPR family response regulator